MATAAFSEENIDIGRVVQRGFQTIGRHAAPFLGLALLLGALPAFLLSMFLVGDPAAVGMATFLAPSYWLTLLVTMIAGYVLQATLVRASILDLSGRDPDIGGSVSVALKLLLPMIGVAILSSILIGIGALLLVVPGVIVYLMLIVTVPALVEERRGVIESMQRSRALTKGSRGRIFLLMLLFIVAYFIVNMVMGFVFGIAGLGALTVAALVQAVSGGLVALLMAAMLASLYVELRTVKEGATTEGLAEIFA